MEPVHAPKSNTLNTLGSSCQEKSDSSSPAVRDIRTLPPVKQVLMTLVPSLMAKIEKIKERLSKGPYSSDSDKPQDTKPESSHHGHMIQVSPEKKNHLSHDEAIKDFHETIEGEKEQVPPRSKTEKVGLLSIFR